MASLWTEWELSPGRLKICQGTVAAWNPSRCPEGGHKRHSRSHFCGAEVWSSGRVHLGGKAVGMMSEPAGSLCDGSVAACSLSSSGELDLSCGARFETPGLCKGGYKAPLFGFLCLGILFNTKRKILLNKGLGHRSSPIADFLHQQLSKPSAKWRPIFVCLIVVAVLK